MKILKTIAEVRSWRSEISNVGFVPTMGALHDGHISLVNQSRTICRQTLVSIFVNPTQFNDPKDLAKYPRTLEEDLTKLKEADAVYLPMAEEIYRDQYRYEVREKKFAKLLCGVHRPGHFEGMLTIVMKLFNIVRPTHAFFGEKDYQQLELIRGMVEAFFLDVTIHGVATVREADGLAMSSRNCLLSPAARTKAPLIYQTLLSAQSPEKARYELSQAGFTVDYLEDHGSRRFAAAYLDGVRLIDNVER